MVWHPMSPFSFRREMQNKKTTPSADKKKYLGLLSQIPRHCSLLCHLLHGILR